MSFLRKMENKVYFHDECGFQLMHVEERKKWILKCVKMEQKAVENLNFIFCSDAYLLEKNKQFLNHNTYTDIITFDYCKDQLIIGDVFISIERVKENAESFKVHFEKELDRVLIHGVLHLLGYKDKSDQEKIQMREKEEFYLSLRA